MPLFAANIPAVWPPLFVFAFLWLSLALGRRLLLFLGELRGGTSAERAIIGLALGAAALQLVPLSLGAVGLLGERSLRVAVGAIALVTAKDLWDVAKRASREFHWHRPTLWQLGWAVAVLPVLLLALVFALVPTIDPDGLGYHLTVPKRWLQSGSLQYLPTYGNSNAPMGVEMLFAIALSFVGDSGAKCLHFSLGVLGAIGLILAGKRLHGTKVGFVTATLFLVGPAGIAHLLGNAYVEGAVAFAMITAVLAWLVWFQSGESNWLRCAALLAGVAVSFKITSALFPLALGALTVAAILYPSPVDRRLSDAVAAAPTWSLLPFLAAPVVPWLVRSALITGNPFFPLFAGQIHSRDLSPTSAAASAHYFRYWNWGTSLSDDWTLERRRLLLLVAAAVVVLVGAFAFARLRTWMARCSVVVLVATVLAQMSAVGLYTRFWIPLAAVLMLPLVAMVGPLLSGPWVTAVLVTIAIVASGLQISRQTEDVTGDTRGLIRTAVGLDERRAFLLRHLAVFPIFEYANRELPADARILLSYSCSAGFYLDRTTFCDETFQESLHWTTWDQLVADVRRLGVTHVIAPRALAGGPPLPVAETRVSVLDRGRENALLMRLLGEHAQLLTAAADQGLYVLDARVTAEVR